MCGFKNTVNDEKITRNNLNPMILLQFIQ